MEIPFIMAGDNGGGIKFPGGIFQVIVFALAMALVINAIMPEFSNVGFSIRNYFMKSTYILSGSSGSSVADVVDGNGVNSVEPTAPLCTITAQGSATITNGVVTAVTLSHSGRGYTSVPAVTLSPNTNDPGSSVQPVFDVTKDENGALSIGIHPGSAGSNLIVGTSGVSGTRTLNIPSPPAQAAGCRQN